MEGYKFASKFECEWKIMNLILWGFKFDWKLNEWIFLGRIESIVW